jgi:hypothetical protein
MNKKKRLWIMFGIACCLGLAAYLTPWMAIITAPLPCNNVVSTEVISPDGKFRAVLFERDCGGTTTWSSQISILRRTEKLPNWFGNTFVQDGRPSELNLEMRWTSNSSLELNYPKSGAPGFGPPSKIEPIVRGVHVTAIAR